ncbi:tRNA (adenine-N1)-methyltransferase [Sulfurisphaera ohwakuensis]|uniref:tRNA (adenine-N1)-methyltransferase n=1 Tax=Sulfurisphaera ohwakuensis TaxID=69656 RepID=UPI0036F38189
MIKEEDLITLWIDTKRTYLVKVRKGKKVGSDKGALNLDDIIGLEYGVEVTLSTGNKAYILKPTLIDIYNGLRRPSQVLYPKDIAYMIYSSGIKPGDTVIEAGTGSGFLTISLAHYLGDNGKVITYDIRQDMQEIAKKNVEFLGFSNRVIFKLKDVREGFDETNVDAIFLDMPDPWNVVKFAYHALKPSGSIVIFVPTVNQIEKTGIALKNNGFIDIHAEELILREYQIKENAVRPKNIGVMHTGYIIRGRKSLKSSV